MDIKTLLFAMFLSMVLGTIALFFFAMINRGSRALWLWMASQLAEALAAIVFMLRGVMPEALNIFLGNTLVYAGFPIAMMGVWVFYGQSLRPIKYMVLLWAVFMAVIAWFTFVDPDFTARAITTAGALSVASISLGVILITSSRGQNVGGMGLGWFYIIHSLGYVIRIMGMLEANASTLFNPLVVDQIFYSEGIMAGVIAPLGYILMTNERLLKNLKEQASHDALTNLFNRRAFHERVTPLMSANARLKQPVSLLAIDIDHFKAVNDSYGHKAGDDVLVLLADTLRQELRASDIAARFGGEEFVALLPATTQETAIEVAERLRRAYKQNMASRPQEPTSSSISIGVVCSDTADIGVEAMIEMADERLYAAKSDGRDRVVAR